ncbi:hypothetical protein [Novosphingobium sp.]|uniref:hypothetical protein n=1 Tax=Novosphingobium sp. TaxID=1874826 RepID=UPI0022C52168|nr:hypothetical protein [Novosphingobium sp.]MCZ8019359.1 hypothetical protein [Novosphingobium sp.]MCZ8035174.1 hypothetical protein [Novosphingobium sp.]MCZ8050488.1 hypothetical protein [Novosphingobium sp.]MCZ8058834.1 hypothetical protein [Novosphingobium sp.]MCZ8232279.1 hypothetical protein [Novosphingobium sp.]
MTVPRWLPTLTLALLAAPLAAASKAAAAKPAVAGAPVAQPLTCSLPVSQRDSAASLKRRFGRAAVVTSIAGPEGTTVKAVVLWARDPRRRLEVTFWDEQMTKPAGVLLGDGARHWSVGGIRLGDSLARVEAINGKPFQLGGFEWDYGGYLQDARGGKLGVLPGGCRVSVRFGLSGKGAVENGILGDVTLQSSEAKVRAALPVVTDLAIGWSSPE